MAQAFFDGSLVIDWSESIGHECKISIGGWDSGLIVTGHDQDELSPLSLIDVGDWIFTVDDPAVLEWRRTLPHDINLALELIPNHQSSILRWAVDSPALVDLVVSNPLLLWLLVDDGLLARPTLGELNRRIAHRQRRLCAEVGLEGTEQQVKILRRAAQFEFTPASARDLREVLKNDAICDFLSHESEIKPSTISVVKRYPWMVRHPVKALIGHLNRSEILRYFQDVLRMLDNIESLYRCRTINSLERLHDRLVARINADQGFNFIRDEYGDVRSLPPPPLSGSNLITPLTTQQEIVDEGRELKLCIASYMSAVSLGEYYVYLMKEPERLTIGVAVGVSSSRQVGSQWFLREVRGRCNRYPTHASMKLIEIGLNKCQC